jgi:hypothetical protein
VSADDVARGETLVRSGKYATNGQPRPAPGTHADFIYRAKLATNPSFDDTNEMVSALSCLTRYADMDDTHYRDDPLRPYIGPLLLRIIRENRWQHFDMSLGKKVQHAQFEDFVRAGALYGLQTEPVALRRLVCGDQEVLDALDELLVADNEPGPDEPPDNRPSDGAQLLDDVKAFLARFVVYPTEHELNAHVLWIAHTRLLDVWESTPRIAFLSPEPSSGKSRALEVTEPLVP